MNENHFSFVDRINGPAPADWKIFLIVSSVIALITTSYLLMCQSWLGRFSFPLDDAWIHLQFAKVLGTHFRYAYHPDQAVVAGSTSPLYTFLLASFYWLLKTPNEFAISFGLGIFAFLASSFVLYKLAQLYLSASWIYPLAIVLFYITDPRLYWSALSGMETPWFLLLILTAAWLTARSQLVLAGIVSGLCLWTRPEGLMVAGLLGLCVLFRDWRTSWKFGIPCSLIIASYFAFHWLINRTFLPNTYRAKTEYYSTHNLKGFLTAFAGQYTDGLGMNTLAIAFVISLIALLYRMFKQRTISFELFFPLFFFAHLGLYAIYLPYMYQNGRYLMPVIPFFYLTTGIGIAYLIEETAIWQRLGWQIQAVRTGFVAGVLIVTVFLFHHAFDKRLFYIASAEHMLKLHVAAGEYLATHTSPGDVIATHDIGAIAFYSNRKIIDLVGLVTQEKLGHIRDLNHTKNIILKYKAAKIACLRSWFEVANVEPEMIFDSGVSEKETMLIFDTSSDKNLQNLHFMPPNAIYFLDLTRMYLAQGKLEQAEQALNLSLQEDPDSHLTFLIAGQLFEQQQNLLLAQQSYQRALELCPASTIAKEALHRLTTR